MSAPLSPIPNDAPMVDTNAIVNRRWYLWLYEIWQRIRICIALVGTPYSKANQSASIVTATVATIVQAGLYRVGYVVRVTTIPTTSYSLTVTLTWRVGGVTFSQAFAALTGAPGTLATGFQTGSLPVIRVDSGTVITASFAYVSVGATAMVFGADVPVELVS